MSKEIAGFVKKAEAYLSKEVNNESIRKVEKGIDGKCMGVLPNLLAQNKASSCMEKALKGLEDLIDEAHVILRKPAKRFKHDVVIVGKNRREETEKIWKQLVSEDEQSPSTICVHGALGVGKTAIAAHICYKATNDPDAHFGNVIWVDVKYGAGLLQVQESIADNLDSSKNPSSGSDVRAEPISDSVRADLELAGEDIGKRSGILKKALSKRGRFLLILDSMWQPGLSLDAIGIPELVSGQKLMVTSRILTVFSKMVPSKVFEVQPLSSVDEAWELFKNEMGTLPQNLEELIASDIKGVLLSELDGLPLAISKLAWILRRKHEHVQDPDDLKRAWKIELSCLVQKPLTYIQRRDPELLQHFSDSINDLDEATKSCFIYSALFPKNCIIESKELIEYWMCEGLLGEDCKTLADGMDKGTQIISELKNAHLLQTKSGDEKVKMLNFFRSMAIDVEGARVFIRSGEFLTFPRPSAQKWSSEVKRASFTQLKALKLRDGVDCLNLSTLLLQGNLFEALPEEFFDSMPNLRVLDLSRTSISVLPNSLSGLRKLHALLLRRCSNLKNLPSLSNLQQLIVLDLWETPLKHCPAGIKKMKNLRRFNLSQSKLETFPSNVIGTQLMELEELLMITADDGGYVWQSKKLDDQWQGACIEDLLNLENLAVLELQFFSTEVFDIYVKRAVEEDKLPTNFRFCVGGFQSDLEVGENGVTITGDTISVLPNNTKELHLINCSKMMSVLELEQHSLSHLQVLYVSNFSGLSYLFSVEAFRSLCELRELHVRGCKNMKEIVKPDERGNPARIKLPKLIKMVFFDLPSLKSICSEPQLDCHGKLSVDATKCQNLKYLNIISESMDNHSSCSDLDSPGVETPKIDTTPANVAPTSCWVNVFSRNVDNRKMEQLKKRKNALGDLIEDLKQKENKGAVITLDLPDFIKEMEAFFGQVSESIAEAEKGIDDMCISGLLPNLGVRKHAQTCMEKIYTKLCDEIMKAESMLQKPVKGYTQSGEVAILGEKRRDTTEEIWKQLVTTATAGTICIHGPVGVGKTAIAKYIHNKALYDPTSPFKNVIWVYVESGDGLWKIQEHLANSLEINLSILYPSTDGRVERTSKETLLARAERLRNELSKKGKFLLVIDSVWKPLCLEDIGMSNLKEGKLLVTSCSNSVCDKIAKRKMWEIQPLPTVDDAWQLLKDETRSLSLDSEKEETVGCIKRALEVLDGLPLAIKELADTLVNIKEDTVTSVCDWQNELANWAKQPCNLEHRDSKLFDRFKHFLKNLKEDTRHCFLYTSLYPKNHFIRSKELIDFWMWEGLLGNIETLEGRREKGRRVLHELKVTHLLVSNIPESNIPESGEHEVKMLNLFRSMAIHTMVNDGIRGFIRPAASLTKLPLEYDWPVEVGKASFMQNQISALRLKNNPSFNRLSMLLLQDNPLDLDSDNNFFYHMPNLRFLDLSRTDIRSLPTSLSSLKILQTLLLSGCQNLTDLPDLSNLQGLIVLDLSGTPLKSWPQGIDTMKKLRRLDLSKTKLETFPAKLFGQLSMLEELLTITDHGCLWGSNKVDKRWKGACIEELLGLKKLCVLEIHFLNARVFNMYVEEVEKKSGVPPKFRFCVGKPHNGASVEENSITVIDDHIITLPQRRISELKLMMCGSKILKLQQESWLKDLDVLDVSNFTALQYLFSLETLGSLKNLKKLSVRRCEKMQNIVQPAADDNTSKIVLPKLTTMELFSLPNLESVCHGQLLECSELCSVQVWNCDKFKLPMIFVLGARERKIAIHGERRWLDKLEWDNPGNTNACFEDKPHSHPSLICVEEPVPSRLEATPTWVHKENQQRGSCKEADDTPTRMWPLNLISVPPYTFIRVLKESSKR